MLSAGVVQMDNAKVRKLFIFEFQHLVASCFGNWYDLSFEIVEFF